MYKLPTIIYVFLLVKKQSFLPFELVFCEKNGEQCVYCSVVLFFVDFLCFSDVFFCLLTLNFVYEYVNGYMSYLNFFIVFLEMADKYNHKESEIKWQKFREEHQIYAFSKDVDKPIYSIDTPPPTVSGKIHIGHIFSYTQAEVIARYKRMS